MTLIDKALTLRLAIPVNKLQGLIAVNGIGSQYLSAEWIKLNIYFLRPKAIAKLIIEVYLVPDLKAKLLIGIDILGPKGVTLNFYCKKATIASYGNIDFSITIQSKSNRI